MKNRYKAFSSKTYELSRFGKKITVPQILMTIRYNGTSLRKARESVALLEVGCSSLITKDGIGMEAKRNLSATTITVSDGYNGDTIECLPEPIEKDKTCVRLRVFGSTYLSRWVDIGTWMNLPRHTTTLSLP